MLFATPTAEQVLEIETRHLAINVYGINGPAVVKVDVLCLGHYDWVVKVHGNTALVEVGAKGKTDKASTAEEGGQRSRIDDNKTIQWERCWGARAQVQGREGVGPGGIIGVPSSVARTAPALPGRQVDQQQDQNPSYPSRYSEIAQPNAGRGISSCRREGGEGDIIQLPEKEVVKEKGGQERVEESKWSEFEWNRHISERRAKEQKWLVTSKIEKTECNGVYDGGERERMDRTGDGSEKGKVWEEMKQPRTAPRPYSARSENPICMRTRTRKAAVEASGPARMCYGPRRRWMSSAV
ncbi:hypothetical protein C8R44DRAFT_732970 [Mycena epipterygia]|nr:hypothetical protein C8R44DRAFT_732970 [Mycena epipterygia]